MERYQSKQSNTLWARDVSVEREITRFLDEHFYCDLVTDFHRFKDKGEQLKGKDVIFTWKELVNIIVDEKAQSQYINRNLPTFAFEISSIFSGKRSEGWLFDDKKETEYYLCIWIWAKNTQRPSKDEITKLDCLLIKRNDIINYLEEEGFSKQRIIERESKIRSSGVSGAIDKSNHKYVYYFHTTHLAENPFNVIIRKEKLEGLAVRHFIVRKENYEIL